MTDGTARAGGWMRTWTGRKFWPLDPRPEDVSIEDIAHALANICRFGGHCPFYSVAQHSVLVSRLVSERLKPLALLHDAAEAYVGDMVRPLKLFMPPFIGVEGRIQRVICQHFCLPWPAPSAVKDADDIMLVVEARILLGVHAEQEWPSCADVPVVDVAFEPLPPDRAEAAFLAEWSAS